MPGKVAATNNEWQIAKGYLPCTYYNSFPDFQLAFVNCVTEMINTMLKDGNAQAEVYDAPQFKLASYSEFRGDVPKSSWVFMEEFKRTTTTSVCVVSVIKKFKDLVDFQLILNPIMVEQLGLVDTLFRMTAIPFSLIKLREVLTSLQIRQVLAIKSWQLQSPTAIKDLTHYALHPKHPSGRDISWYKILSVAYNFYGVREIDLNRNAISSLWIFCDAVDTSYVGNVQIPLLQLVPAVGRNTIKSFKRFGMLHCKRINKGRVNTIKIWITETFDGIPIHL